MAQRIKGQEVAVTFTDQGVVQASWNDIRNFEVEFQTEILREGYLGEKTDRRDDVFRGVRGRVEINFEDQGLFTMLRDLIDRARRRIPGQRFNMKATLSFPNGDRPVIILNDVFFGPVPVRFGGRTEYGTVGLDFETQDAQILSG